MAAVFVFYNGKSIPKAKTPYLGLPDSRVSDRRYACVGRRRRRWRRLTAIIVTKQRYSRPCFSRTTVHRVCARANIYKNKDRAKYVKHAVIGWIITDGIGYADASNRQRRPTKRYAVESILRRRTDYQISTRASGRAGGRTGGRSSFHVCAQPHASRDVYGVDGQFLLGNRRWLAPAVSKRPRPRSIGGPNSVTAVRDIRRLPWYALDGVGRVSTKGSVRLDPTTTARAKVEVTEGRNRPDGWAEGGAYLRHPFRVFFFFQ